jgi:5-formyltetrahydrofolate cyclo-ligase
MTMTDTARLSDLSAIKAALRHDMTERRRDAAARAVPNAAEIARDNFLASIPLPSGATVSAFWPLPDEFDTRPIMFALHEAGHPIGLPVVEKRGLPLRFRVWEPGMPLVRGNFNVETPSKDQPECVPEILIVPLLAFDREGYRLGYGGGFYDRTIAGLRAMGPTIAVGYAYAGQEIDAVPHDGTDAQLDWVVTERAAVRIAR